MASLIKLRGKSAATGAYWLLLAGLLLVLANAGAVLADTSPATSAGSAATTTLAQHDAQQEPEDEQSPPEQSTLHGESEQIEEQIQERAEEAGVEHGPGPHGEAEGGHGGVAHLNNLVTIIAGALSPGGKASPTALFLERFLDPIFSGLTAILLALFFAHIYTRRSQDPGRLQMAAELIIGGLYHLFEVILGPQARRFVPFLGTLFLFILVNNLMGLVPLLHSSTSSINTTVALAICTFFYVQWIGMRENGILGYLHHLAGSPHSAMEWGFSLLLFPLHVLGELIKPLSLSLRLFGNIFGEDALIATMVVLGAGLMHGLHIPVGLPLQFPFLFLAMLTSTIQALVFALLSTVYIALMLPHEDHGEMHEH
jgi:F-type H+-transporting ATPase subunit a